MIHLHFNLQLMQFFVDHRNVFLTRLFVAASFFGSAAFYILLTSFLFVAWDKRQAIRLSVLILLTILTNDALKIFIKNPRPFIEQGTYRQKWAVSPRDATVLATEYSTPSGHAMGSSAFYSYVFTLVKNRFVRVILVVAVVLIGASRPYLGVHYVEDVLLGWLVGLILACGAIRYIAQLAEIWERVPYGLQIVIALAASFAVWLLALALDGRINDQVRELTAYSGLLTGIVVGFPLELRITNFDPRSRGALAKILRYAISLGVMAFVLFALKLAWRPFAASETAFGCALEYVRYVAAESAAIFAAPFIFCKLKLADHDSST
jgi:membrane-associated phospholipid phosphatase